MDLSGKPPSSQRVHIMLVHIILLMMYYSFILLQITHLKDIMDAFSMLGPGHSPRRRHERDIIPVIEALRVQ